MRGTSRDAADSVHDSLKDREDVVGLVVGETADDARDGGVEGLC